MTSTLPALLDEMTRDLTQIESHPDRLKAIARQFPHSIRVLTAPFDEPLGEFNCVMYALGLTARLESVCSMFGRFYADTSFLRYLIDRSILQPCHESAGALVLWSSGDSIKHVGVMVESGRARSKWGIGHVYEHGLSEVPLSYGESLSYYGALEPDVALSNLVNYLPA